MGLLEPVAMRLTVAHVLDAREPVAEGPAAVGLALAAVDPSLVGVVLLVAGAAPVVDRLTRAGVALLPRLLKMTEDALDLIGALLEALALDELGINDALLVLGQLAVFLLGQRNDVGRVFTGLGRLAPKFLASHDAMTPKAASVGRT